MNNPMTKKTYTELPLAAKKPKLKVVGLGGGGSNAINRMIELGLSGIEFIAANTDTQALQSSQADIKLQLGPSQTRGLGSGGDPRIGEISAEESTKELEEALSGADMVFLTAGMGGGTGTGAIPVAARIARSTGAVTVAIVTMPFSFEVGRRQANAREGLAKLRQYCDTLITIPNDRLLKVAPKNLPLDMAFRLADDVLRQGIQGISELITEPGVINVDFSHIRQIMHKGGGSLLSIGVGQGENKAQKAIERALHHPLLEEINLENASGIIANFTAGSDLSFVEVYEALNKLQEMTKNHAEIIPGVITDDRMQDRVEVILIITGMGTSPSNPVLPIRASKEIPNFQPTRITSSMQQQIQKDVEVEIPEPCEVAGATQDLDIPAFLRRRIR